MTPNIKIFFAIALTIVFGLMLFLGYNTLYKSKKTNSNLEQVSKEAPLDLSQGTKFQGTVLCLKQKNEVIDPSRICQNFTITLPDGKVYELAHESSLDLIGFLDHEVNLTGTIVQTIPSTNISGAIYVLKISDTIFSKFSRLFSILKK